ncbi:MAG: hypothetical protein ABI193_19055 [Minicystis sp.]
MKYRLGAAVAALFLGIIPGTVSAESASSWILNTKYVTDTHTLSGVDRSWNQLSLRHTPGTQHRFATTDLSAFPPDPCRLIASAWNGAVFQDREQSAFDYLLKVSAAHNCALDVEHATAANADGSFDLVSVAPTP